MKIIKKQAVENYRIGKIVIEFCLLFRYEQYMKQRYTAAIKSDCFEKQKVRNREQGNIFFIYKHIITEISEGENT